MKDSCLKPWGFPSNMWKYTWNFALAPHYLCVKINVGHLPRLQSSEMQPANQLNQPSNLYFNTLPKPPTHAIVMDISTRFPSPPPKKKAKKMEVTWVSTFPSPWGKWSLSVRIFLRVGQSLPMTSQSMTPLIPRWAHTVSWKFMLYGYQGRHKEIKIQIVFKYECFHFFYTYFLLWI